MTDFLPWLYRHYIRPCQEEHIDGSPYEMSLALIESDLAPEDRRHFEKSREFWSIQTFLLGLSTGAGLERAFRSRD